MSQGNVYWYFSSKEDLLKAVLVEGFETLGALMVDATARKGTSPEKLEILVNSLIGFAKQMGDFNTIMLSLLSQGGDAMFNKLGFDMSQIGMGYTRSVASIISEGQEEGTIDKRFEPLQLTMFFFSLFNGLNLTYGSEWTEIPPQVITSAMKRLVGVIP
jgi:AcrR family transcriptional regulator